MVDTIVVDEGSDSVTLFDREEHLSFTITEETVAVTENLEDIKVTVLEDGVAIVDDNDYIVIQDPPGDEITPVFSEGIVQTTNNYVINNGSATATAVVDIAAGVVMASFDGGLRLADKDADEDIDAVIGVVVSSVLAGEEVTIQLSGELLNLSWNWTLNAPIYLGNNGVLTQTLPTTGFIQRIGFPILSTKMLIDKTIPVRL